MVCYTIAHKYRTLLWHLDLMRGTRATAFNSSQPSKIFESENTCKRMKHFKFSFCCSPFCCFFFAVADYLGSLVRRIQPYAPSHYCLKGRMLWSSLHPASSQMDGWLLLPLVTRGGPHDGLCLQFAVPSFSTCYAPFMCLEVKLHGKACAH